MTNATISPASWDSLMAVVELLADGRVCSGEFLGARLGVSRTAVWKQLKKLEGIGLVVESIRGAGYRLQHPLDLLDADTMLASEPGLDDSGIDIHLLPVVDSTNTWAAQRLRDERVPPSGVVLCAAEMQLAGRGRRGRQWVSPFASNLYFSLGMQSGQGIALFEGLSLAVGAVIHRFLTELGFSGLGLKWPNDILFNGRKLAGILIEIDGDLAGNCNLVVGVGINCAMGRLDKSAYEQIDQPWVDLNTLAVSQGLQLPSRSQLLAGLALRVGCLMQEFPAIGFAGFKAAWAGADCFLGRAVVVKTGAEEHVGISRGVDQSGALQVEIDGVIRLFSGGEVSLRSQS
ncbi:biotin--[acetyl-CoA-carboxylase] ligase [Halioxenophilus sp. WMMB6]|uniref:biotin--[acetyl-CoA-carboxylase] ligase n=1 Tax=Halioxenophilus sp. WMMB6 TaxID=3073815 RepID=UPI00295ECC35|nr:biotin--[acetyl-CoA-carboxylase] ligase [Halioxenophilus sp. WMMB6]